MAFQTSVQASVRYKTGAPRLTSPLSVVSTARDFQPDDLPIVESITPTRETGGFAAVIARSLLWTAQLGDITALKHVLVVEPRTRNIGTALREAGRQERFSGETTALMHMPLPRVLSIAQGYDHTITQDWFPPLEVAEPGKAETSAADGAASAQERLGAYDALIVSDLTRILPPDRLTQALTWLSTCLNPLGYLVFAEPAHLVNGMQLTRALLEHGLELVDDPRIIAEDWPRTLLIWRRRSPSETQRSGVAQRIVWSQLAQDRPLQRRLVTTYQEVFGGEEWREWVRCVRPGCERHYSRAQAQALQPANRCVCGWREPLQPFHRAEDVLARLYRDLTPSDTSCAYIRFGDVAEVSAEAAHERTVAGFAWGYLTDAYRLTRTLLPAVAGDDDTSAARDELAGKLDGLLQQAQRDDNPPVIYYHAEIGVVDRARSLNLTRYLFERSLRFARAQGADVVILRTSLRSPVFRLLTGLDMRPLYWYADAEQAEHLRAARVGAARLAPESADADLESQVDERVVLWGDVAALLNIFSTHSDFRLAGRIARGLRAARGERNEGERSQ
ncbi:MAG TPA: hypothetical protein VFU60_00630 [Ktedonobacterales bacterium]|nr:hypothetical protein [Ktedonobacterales bacterium]